MLTKRKKAVRAIKRYIWSFKHPSFVPVLRHLVKSSFQKSRSTRLPADRAHLPVSEFFLSGSLGPSRDIPKIVFQTWKSRTIIPSNYRSWRESFFRLNPDYDVILWDDDDNRKFVEARFPWFLPIYDAYPREIFRADAVRPLFLFAVGGYYADMDCECLKNLDFLRSRSDILLGQMGSDLDFEHSIPNALMASRPFQIFWLLYARLMIDVFETRRPMNDNDATPEEFTGPILLRNCLNFYRAHTEQQIREKCSDLIKVLPTSWQTHVECGSIEVLGQDEWYPLDWTNPVHRRLRWNINQKKAALTHDELRQIFPNSSMVTYWSHSW